jgi:hypothetical protein
MYSSLLMLYSDIEIYNTINPKIIKTHEY